MNEEVISLADSQVLRWIDEINDITDADAKAREIKIQIRQLRREPNSPDNKKEIRRLYSALDDIQFKPDYMFLIIDKKKDYYRACKGFYINNIKYVRLLGTNGGIKNSTIVFVNEDIVPEIRRRIDNGRDLNRELVTAKLEAYKALACSASNPVSMPHGIAVVDDAETEFFADYTFITNEGTEEPVMSEVKQAPVKIDASDGFGLMLPSLAERWSEELGLRYTVPGVNTRFSFEKGMVFTFDFLDFAENVAHTYFFRDAWGEMIDIRNVELILTTSMVKLWDSYKNINDYLSNSINNNYSFGVTKTCPKELESEHTLNYQFIQSFRLSDEDIDELIEPTVSEIEEVLHGDWRKTILFLKGIGLNDKSVINSANDYIKAIMIDPRVLNDPFVQNSVYRLIQGRINKAKTGVLKVHGNYSMISGDPYLLCESIFGLEKAGLLKAGEIYNQYWAECESDQLLCFRAPMSTHANIRKVSVVKDDKTKYWYQYMSTVTILNAWDTMTAALNGCDFDGDLVMLTDNEVLLRNHRELPAIMCDQQKAEKKVSNEEDFIKANIASFGNEIGQTTNYITSMYEVQAGYPEDSEEFKTLEYRIMSGQLIQQQIIDKAKGIIARPMPRVWHDSHAAKKMEDGAQKDLYLRIAADKKPYFMRYIYPSLNSQYTQYLKDSKATALTSFGLTIEELQDTETLSEEQKEFLERYDYHMPIGVRPCVMNTICRKIEDKLDSWVMKNMDKDNIDYSYLLAPGEYTSNELNKIRKLYKEFNKRVSSLKVKSCYERIDSYDMNRFKKDLQDEFISECAKVCPNESSLYNILFNICYEKESAKGFFWLICGDSAVKVLLSNNNNHISFPVADPNGDIEYCGQTFSLKTINVEEYNVDNIE